MVSIHIFTGLSRGRVGIKKTVIIDITPLKTTEESIEHSNTLIKGILDSSTDIGIIATDRDGIITLFNKGAEKLLGYRSDELVG